MRRRNNATPVDERQHRDMLLRPPEKTKKEVVRDFFWDPKNKTCLTRTPINWLAITVYYIIFISCVMGLFVVAMLIVYYCVNSEEQPQYVLNESALGSTPSLNYFPLIEKRSLIWLSSDRDYEKYVDSIEKEFQKYKNLNRKFVSEQFGECGTPPFGYDTHSPCIFFRLNRLISWRPEPFKKGDKIPDSVPSHIRSYISNSSTPRVWLSCKGLGAKDRDHIPLESFQFQGPEGFDVAPFPYQSQTDFLDPIVAIKFKKFEKHKILYTFSCSAWGHGIDPKTTEVEVNLFVE